MSRAAALACALIAACASHDQPIVVVAMQGAGPIDHAVAMPAPAPASTAPVVQLSAAGHHTCTRHDDGAVSCWGDNSFGQLGLDASARPGVPDGRRNRTRPVPAPIAGALEIAAGARRTCARRDDGVTCWGNPAGPPEPIAGTADLIEIAGPCGRTARGQVRCWQGLQAADPLPTALEVVDLGGFEDRVCAVQVDGEIQCTVLDQPLASLELVTRLEGAVEVAPGGIQTCARTDAGAVWCWNNPGQGHADTTPHLIDGVPDTAQVVSGQGFACTRDSAGAVRCWGTVPGRDPYANVPVTIDGVRADELAAGAYHVCARDGAVVLCWGANLLGEIGTGWAAVQSVPQLVPGIDDAIDVHVGREYSCVRRRTGDVSCWGRIWSYGEGTAKPYIHHGAEGARQLAGEVELCARFDNGDVKCGYDALTIKAKRAIQIAVSERHGVAIERGGTAWTWARGYSREPVDDKMPEDPAIASGTMVGVEDAVAAAITGRTTCLIRGGDGRGGEVACTESFNPVQTFSPARLAGRSQDLTVPGIDHAVELAVGQIAGCAAIAGGTVECWGSNAEGQLGRGAPELSTRAVRIAGLDRVVQIAGAGHTTCVRRSDRTVRCWGSNQHGLLGDPLALARSPDPITIPLTGVIDISVAFHACAVLETGQVACWGLAELGQVGTRIAGVVDSPSLVAFP